MPIDAYTDKFYVFVSQHLNEGTIAVPSFISETYTLRLEIQNWDLIENGHRPQLGRFRPENFGLCQLWNSSSPFQSLKGASYQNSTFPDFGDKDAFISPKNYGKDHQNKSAVSCSQISSSE